MKSPIELVRQFVSDRQRAYKLTFNELSPAHKIVLTDLAFFCRANESCVVPGDRDKTLMLEGRREVWLRIQQNLKLSEDQVFQLYAGTAPLSKDTSK